MIKLKTLFHNSVTRQIMIANRFHEDVTKTSKKEKTIKFVSQNDVFLWSILKLLRIQVSVSSITFPLYSTASLPINSTFYKPLIQTISKYKSTSTMSNKSNIHQENRQILKKNLCLLIRPVI